MSKYSDIVVDMKDGNHSLTQIINMVPCDTKVLDFGCSSGYLGEYLQKNKGCNLMGFELDQVDAEEAEKYYEKVVVCDLDTDEWEKEVEGKYDVAIFADVLEHLKYPDRALEKVQKLLTRDGRILVSIPNIAHLSVRLELLRGHFDYEDTGILDNTHLKYWTKNSFERLIDSLGLTVLDLSVVQKAIPASFGEKYFGANYQYIRDIASDPEAEIYQYVFSLAKKDGKSSKFDIFPKFKLFREVEDVFMKQQQEIEKLRILQAGKKETEYFAQLFVDTGSGYKEALSERVEVKGNERVLEFDVSVFNGVKGLRFDPLNRSLVVDIEGVRVFDEFDNMYFLKDFSANALYCEDRRYVFITNDPQVYGFTLDGIEKPKKVIIDLKYIHWGAGVVSELQSWHQRQLDSALEEKRCLQLDNERLDFSLMGKDNEIHDFRNEILSYEQKTNRLNQDLHYKHVHIQELEDFLSKERVFQEELLAELREKEVIEGKSDNIIFQLEESNKEYVAEIERQIVEIDTKNITLSTQKSSLSSLRQLVGGLSNTIEVQGTVISALYSSFSWKISAPIRLLGRLYLKLRLVFADLRLGLCLLWREGFFEFIRRVYWYLRGKRLLGDILVNSQASAVFVDKNDIHEHIELEEDNIESLDYKPKISLVVDIRVGGISRIESLMQSCFSQSYENWELYICDDVSLRGSSKFVLERLSGKDYRIHILSCGKNDEIKELLRSVFPKLSGEYILYLDDLVDLDKGLFPEFIRKVNDTPLGEERQVVEIGKFLFHRTDFLKQKNEGGDTEKTIGSDVKCIAFYLPQFHEFPENELFWGRGFTEWTNVSGATALFKGHYQPRVPSELGFYDLKDPEVLDKQAKLAKEYGISGFCYYLYWFDEQRIMHTPIERMLKTGKPDMPFSLCWANENWTRRWDGKDKDILLEQNHCEEDDMAFIQNIVPYFRDSRYIRVRGMPMFLIYRVHLLPDCKRTVRLWREYCREVGIGEIYLGAVQSFGIGDPRAYGFDFGVEFPPQGLAKQNFSLESSLDGLDPEFKGEVFDYLDVIRSSIGRKVPDYPLYKGIMPSWDNTARRQKDSHLFVNASPEEYETWLSYLHSYTRDHFSGDERFIFINAWNEWAEGCYLEPDLKNGRAYLQATRRVVLGNNHLL